MKSLFLTVLNMSLTASYTVVAVMVVRLLLRKAPKVFSYALWGIVFFRLLCPFSLESPLSLVPEQTIIPQDIVFFQNPGIETGIVSVDSPVNHSIRTSLPPEYPAPSTNSMTVITEIGAVIWVVGIVLLFLSSIVSYCRLKQRLSTATLVKGNNVFETDQIQTPFVLGFFQPKIYLPPGLDPKEMDYILWHEKNHIKRGDHIIKLVAFAATVLHWFNPLIWLSYFLMSKDMEMSCDEMVLGQAGGDIRAHYSHSLLSLAAKQSGLLIPPAFGESNVKSRIMNVLKYRKPSTWIMVTAITVVMILAVVLMVDPIESKPPSVVEEFLQYKTKYVGDATAVGSIIYLLDYPEGIDYDHFELHTVSPSYGVTVYLQTDTEIGDYYTAKEAAGQASFTRNAIIMFSLIENVDYINFNLNDGQNDFLLRYSRDEADATMGKDVREFAQGKEEFARLLAILDALEESSSVGYVGGVERASIAYINGNYLPKQYRKQFSDYMIDRFTSEYSKYYQIKGFEVSNLEYTVSDTDIEITFFFKMIFQNYYKDPDTIPYIREAKENDSPYYEQMRNEYNQPKEGNYDLMFRAKINAGTIVENSIELFINQAPKGVDYVPLKELV
ncbi:MAG: M56 family metallopeptidase [bacterium]